MSDTVCIDQGQLRQITLRPGQQLLCRSGCVWLSHDGRDIVLRPGDSYLSGVRQTLLCEALQTSWLWLGALAKAQPSRAKWWWPRFSLRSAGSKPAVLRQAGNSAENGVC